MGNWQPAALCTGCVRDEKLADIGRKRRGRLQDHPLENVAAWWQYVQKRFQVG